MHTLRVALLSLLFWTTTSLAYFGIDYKAPAVYFTYQADGNTQYVFAMAVAEQTGDIYFHMSGPVEHAWLGVGIGNSMDDAFMLVAYPSDDGLKTTTSPRRSTGHVEPEFDPSVGILKIYNDTYAPAANTVTDDGTGTIISHAVCLKCMQWANSTLDLRSKAQPMLFAIGPKMVFRATDEAASIPRHGTYGQFTMDMTQATNYTGWYGRVPAPNIPDFAFPPSDSAFSSFGSSPGYNEENMSNPKPTVHAVLMCVAFVFIFPMGSATMRFARRTLWHGALQAIGVGFVVVGFGIAASFSTMYNKSKDFNSAHQIIGLIVLAGLLVQLGLGLVHHSMYVKKQEKTPYGKVHLYLGPFVVVLGLINGGIGFDFARNGHLNVPYGIVVAIVALIFLGLFGFQRYMQKRRVYKPEQEAFQYPDFASLNQHSDGSYEMPYGAEYGMQPPQPYEPTTPYTVSVPAPYTPTTPYTPTSAYTPVTPKTWRKEEITRWPSMPYKEFED